MTPGSKAHWEQSNYCNCMIRLRCPPTCLPNCIQLSEKSETKNNIIDKYEWSARSPLLQSIFRGDIYVSLQVGCDQLSVSALAEPFVSLPLGSEVQICQRVPQNRDRKQSLSSPQTLFVCVLFGLVSHLPPKCLDWGLTISYILLVMDTCSSTHLAVFAMFSMPLASLNKRLNIGNGHLVQSWVKKNVSKIGAMLTLLKTTNTTSSTTSKMERGNTPVANRTSFSGVHSCSIFIYIVMVFHIGDGDSYFVLGRLCC